MAMNLFSASFFCYFHVLVITLLPLCFLSVTCAILSNETDRLALLEFKFRITDDPLEAMRSWNSSIHFCQWNGVTCGTRHQRVIELDLQSQNLAGSISPHIGNLSFLAHVHLQNNSLSKEIPPEIGRLRRLQTLILRNNSLVGEVPANLSSCHDLTVLNMRFKSLSGQVPSELGSLVKLKVFDFSRNKLTGHIPFAFGNLSSLVRLSISVNHLSGAIPYSLGQLQNLTFFEIADNSFEGTIPPSIFNLSSMESFDVAINKFQGSLPPDLFIYFSHITFFSTGVNQFVGPIPPSLSNASNLHSFYLTTNNFTGKVPNLENLRELYIFAVGQNSLGLGVADDLNFLSSLANSTALQFIQLTSNNLGGPLPESVGNLSSQLLMLAIEENQIVGTIPAGIVNLTSLETLSMTRNHLSGSIPADLANLGRLRLLYLSENQLEGNIPSWIGSLDHLIKLSLRRNNLQGSIPPSLGNCTDLLSLVMGNNNISGTLPPQLFNISSLAIQLDLSNNHLTGTLPVEVGNLNNLGALYISGNRLSGEIPTTVGSCLRLEELNMQENSFHGTIPLSLSSLKGLQYLDLSHNNLSGEIPKFLENLIYLKTLNLSFNHFVGMVPKEGAFKNVSATSVEGNNELCGGIAEFHLPKCNLNEHVKSKRLSHKLKIIIATVLGFLGAIAVTSSLLLFWLRKRNVKIETTSLENLLVQVSYRALFKAADGFSLSNLIGVGSFSYVYKGTLDGGQVVAVKVFNLERRGAFKSFMAECEAMRSIRHRNLLKVITACSSIDIHGNDFKALVYEFMVNGSLEKWLQPTPVSDITMKLNLVQRLNIAIDVVCALNYLHHQHGETPIVHCDLKPSNILLDDEMTAKVGDFGLVKFLLEETNNTSTDQPSSAGLRGTIGYAAPEYGMGSEVSTHGDVYSYGILLLEIFSGKKPTDHMFNDNLNLHNYVKRALPDHVAEIVEPMLVDRRDEDETEISSERDQKVIQLLVLIFGIGIGCSEEIPRERMDISDAAAKLVLIRDKLTDNGERGMRAQRTQSAASRQQVPRIQTSEA